MDQEILFSFNYLLFYVVLKKFFLIVYCNYKICEKNNVFFFIYILDITKPKTQFLMTERCESEANNKRNKP